MTTRNIVHLSPVWRDRANFIIGVWCQAQEDSDTQIWEQLWSRQIADNRFQICCIPFFAYNLSLGDEVETISEGGKRFVVKRVINPSGHYTFRVWFSGSSDVTTRGEVLQTIAAFGCLKEWYSTNLLGVDAESVALAEVADFLAQREELGHLIYETGRTNVE